MQLRQRSRSLIQLCMRSSAEPSGAHSLGFVFCFFSSLPPVYFFLFSIFSVSSSLWTTDLFVVSAAKETKPELNLSSHILSLQIGSCTRRRSTTSWVRSQSFCGTWAFSTTAWRASTCPPGSTVRGSGKRHETDGGTVLTLPHKI